MQPTIFSISSAHFRLARTYGKLRVHNEGVGVENEYGYFNEYKEVYVGDICTYIKACAKGLFGVFIITVLSIIVLAPVVEFIAYAIASILTGQWAGMDVDASMGAIILSVVALAAGCVLGIKGYLLYRKKFPIVKKSGKRKDTKPTKPSFLREVYRKFKDKTCIRIRVE